MKQARYTSINQNERRILIEIVRYMKQNTEQIEILGDKYNDSYYYYLHLLKKHIRQINRNYRGIHLDLTISEYYELRLIVACGPIIIEKTEDLDVIEIRKRFDSRAFLKKMFLIPKSSKTPLTWRYLFDQMY